ncbi:MAG: ATP-dependent DNA ligase [Acidimicrobiia bacterium]
MRFADLVDVGRRVAATGSRIAKTALLAEVISRLEDDELEPGVWFLAGGIRQGRLGVGFSGAYGVEAPPAAEPSLTVSEVDRMLGELPSVSGPGSQAERARRLTELLGRATLEEQDLVRRLLTGGVRQGALEAIVVEAVAAASGAAVDLVRRAVMLTGDVGRAAAVARFQGISGLESVRLQPMIPIRPMLAASASGVGDAVDGEVAVEWKLDGARIQVHRHAGRVRVFTRNLNDVTDRMPEVVREVAGLDVSSVVLDGEALALRPDGTPQPFQETMSRFGTESTTDQPVLHPYFFDLLEHDGTTLIDLPLDRRQARLDAVVPKGLRVPRLLTDDPDSAERFLRAALDAGQEGVVVKRLDSVYEAGRRGAAWRKVKPVHTYDLVVLAAEWGHGRRQGRLSNIHLGARDGDGFTMVGKTFKGMTDAMLEWQTERFLALEERRTRSTVYLRPEQVAQVAIDGVQASSRYSGGVALRFARVVRYRDDKPAGEADTLAGLRELLR